jgi:hypothetical protein
MLDPEAYRSQHARRQLGYGIVLLLATALLALLIRVYLVYSPGDTGMPLTQTNQIRMWAIPIAWAVATCCAFVSSFRLSHGAAPTAFVRYLPLLCLFAGAIMNVAFVAVARLSGML